MSRQFPVLRGLAIFFVLLHHSITLSLWMAERLAYRMPHRLVLCILLPIKELGLFAVPIFLFISGAFFAFAVQNRPLLGAYRAVMHNIKVTIWPYLIWSGVFYVTVFLLLKEHYSPLAYVKNLLVGYPYNFVPLLLVYYLLAPGMVLAARRWPVLFLSIILLYQIVLANLNQPGLLGFAWPGWMEYLAPPVIKVTLSHWAIYFPLGIVYNLHNRSILGAAQKYDIAIFTAVVLLFVAALLHELGLVSAAQAGYLFPFFGMLLIPLIRREVVPFFRWFEDLGKRSYGLYLTNQVVITGSLFTLHVIFPWLLEQYLILFPVLVFLSLTIPWGMMIALERPPQRVVYQFIFG